MRDETRTMDHTEGSLAMEATQGPQVLPESEPQEVGSPGKVPGTVCSPAVSLKGQSRMKEACSDSSRDHTAPWTR